MSTTAIAGPARQAATGATPSKKRALPYRTISWTVPVLLLLAWELASRAGLIAANVLPAPSSVGATAWRLTQTGVLPHHLWESVKRAAVGLAIGATVGLVLGVLTGFSRPAGGTVDRKIPTGRATPLPAALPL